LPCLQCSNSTVYLDARKHFLCFQKYSALFFWFSFTFFEFGRITNIWCCRLCNFFCLPFDFLFELFFFFQSFAFIFGISVAFGHESWFICAFFFFAPRTVLLHCHVNNLIYIRLSISAKLSSRLRERQPHNYHKTSSLSHTHRSPRRRWN